MSRKPFADLFREHVHNRVGPAKVLITNKAGPKATIRLYTEIGWFGVTADEFGEALDEITADEIEVQINSMGGDVFDGIAIYNALRSHPAKITTRVDGMAASIASVIVQAGDERVMLTGSQMMIHPAWGFAMGDAVDMRKLAEILDRQTDVIAGIYTERGGENGFRALMDAETWFDADETIEAGLADQAVTPKKSDGVPSDDATIRFTEQADAAVVALVGLADRTEDVVTFRTGQGKPPLSEDSVEIFQRLGDVKERLDAIVAETEQSDLPGDIASEYAKYIQSSQE